MAITIQDQPTANTFYSVGNPIELLVSSNQTAQTNYKFNVRVYYDPAGANTLLATLKYDIIPSTTQALINISPIILSRIAENITNLRTSATGVKNETLKYHTVNVVVNDFYGAIPAMVASGSATSNTILYYNGSLKFIEWVNGDLAGYRLASGTGVDTLSQKLLTKFSNVVAATDATVSASPSTYFGGAYRVKKITSSQLEQIQWLWQGSSGTNIKVQFAFFTSSYALHFSYNKSLTSTQCMASMNIGTAALLAIGSGTILNLDNTDKYFYVCIKNNTYQLTGCYLFEIDWSPCGRFDTFEIHWLNSLGGWDSWIFNKRSKKDTLITRREFNPTRIPISGSSINHNIYDITNKNYVISTSERYSVNSDWMNEDDYTALEDLITSPLVYWNSSNGFINIAINKPETFTKKQNTIDKLFNLSFDFVIDNQNRRQ